MSSHLLVPVVMTYTFASAPCARLQPSAISCERDAQAGEAVVTDHLREKPIKVGAKVVSHGRYVTFQIAEVAVSRQMFQEILSLIARPRAPPAPA